MSFSPDNLDVRTAVLVVAVLLVEAAGAHAQGIGVGFTGGIALDPTQGFAGTFVESPPLGGAGGHIHFRPGIDGTTGSGVSDAVVDVFFIYKIPAGALSRWTFYQGTGAVVAIERANEELHPHGGFGGLFGIANANGFFFEFKVGGGGGPSLRLGVGYTVRRKEP